MKIEKLASGKYVVAVSGGVDSVTLLNVLSKQPKLELIVAHFDHGIRPTSADDRKFVENLAKSYSLPFESEAGKLGKNASEALARNARYKFLYKIQKKHKAKAVVTAHHQDDLIETIIINMLRGTGRKGVTALQNQNDLLRPMLQNSKHEIISYAEKNGLEWQEDISNLDTAYLRNWVRHNIIPKLSTKDRQTFLKLHEDFSKRNPEIDRLLAGYISQEITKFSRQDIIMADHNVAKELVAGWLRANNVRDFDQKTIERIVIGAKTLGKGKSIPVTGSTVVEVQDRTLLLKP